MTSRILSMTSLALALAGCGGSGGSSGTSGGPVTRPEGSVIVSFTVDDSANQTYGAGGLRWTGDMKYVESSRVVTVDTTGNGPFPLLWDDGPWEEGGHEAAGEVAGDHRFGIAVFIAPPTRAKETDPVPSPLAFTYGVEDVKYAALPPAGFASGSIWPGTPGTFSVAFGDTADLTLPDLVIPAFGTTDLKLVLDTAGLAAGSWDTSRVFATGSAWPWADVRLLDDGLLGDDAAGDGKYTFLLSEYVGAGHPFAHTGLLASGTAVDFAFVLRAQDYRDGGGVGLTAGVTAFTRTAGGAFTPATVTVVGTETRVVAP
jgi:hypothetical protein